MSISIGILVMKLAQLVLHLWRWFGPYSARAALKYEKYVRPPFCFETNQRGGKTNKSDCPGPMPYAEKEIS